MKNILVLFTVVLLSLSFTANTFAGSTNCEKGIVVPCEIESYLNDTGFNYHSETITVFSNFIVKENDDLYTVDFMVTEDGELIVLSKNLEEEYYKVDHYTSDYMKKHQVPVANVTAPI